MTHPSDSNQSELEAAPVSELVPAVMRFLRVVRLRQRVVFATLIGAILVGGLYCAVATRYYASAAKLLIVQQNQDHLATVSDHTSNDNTMATHRELVTSEIVLRDAIDHLAPEYRVDLVNTAPRDWVKKLKSKLAASTTRKTNFIDVSYRSRRPEAAAAVVQAVIDAYLRFVERTHKGAAGEVINVLTSERTKLQKDLAAKQEELQQFRQRVGHLSVDPDDGVVEPIVQRAVHLNDSLLKAQEKRLELQAALASVDQAAAAGEDVNQHLAAIEATVGRQMLLTGLGLSQQDMQVLAEQERKMLAAQDQLRSVSAFYGPNHPQIAELKQQIADVQSYLKNYRHMAGQRFQSAGGEELASIVQKMLRQAVQQAQGKEDQLQASFEEARTAAAQQSGDIVRLQMLGREVARLESLHDVLFDKIATVDIRQVQAPIQATVVREPLPEPRPVSPRLRVVGVISLLAGLVLGCVIVVVLDVLDDRFTSPEEMQTQLGVPVLAMVRQMGSLEGEGIAGVHTHARPTGVEAEAFRTLRTAVTLSGRECERIAVSSSEPGDGKTTITVNLALAFAQAGKRTLVIDADLRKPGFTTLLGMKRQPGVADALVSEGAVEEAAAQYRVETAAERLDVLPAGLRRTNPSELLSSQRFAELLTWADAHYDQVIVDCPPVLAVSDAHIVSRLVDGAILVVRPEKNHRRAVLRAVESFHATGGVVLGVVANGLSEESAGYGYGYHYGYGYGYGYGHNDEKYSDEKYSDENHNEENHSEATYSEETYNAEALAGVAASEPQPTIALHSSPPIDLEEVTGAVVPLSDQQQGPEQQGPSPAPASPAETSPIRPRRVA